MAHKTLAVAVGSRRVGYVYFEDRVLVDFALSRKAAMSPTLAVSYLQKWIGMLNPNMVITERIRKHSRKGAKSRAITEALTREAAKHELQDISIVREQHYPNKYVEADVLAKRFPDLQAYVPRKPKIWECEPVNVRYFEAISLALPIIDAAEAT